MDIREFTDKFADATRNMSPEQREALVKMLESVSGDLPKGAPEKTGVCSGEGTEIPDGITERLQLLKDNYLKQVPSITTYRARAITKIAKENPGMPKILLRAKCFRYCCETAPLVIQDHELIDRKSVV